MIEEEGLPAVLERHRRLSAALRAGCVALGLPMFPTAPTLSPTVTAACVPAGLEGGTIVRHMHARYRTVIAGQRTKLSGRIIRFGTMGFVDGGDILTDLHHLECTLRDLGRAPPPGAGEAEVPELPEGLVLDTAFDVHGSLLFEAGALTPQSRASMLVARMLGPQPGETVLDLGFGGGSDVLMSQYVTTKPR